MDSIAELYTRVYTIDFHISSFIPAADTFKP